MDQAEEIWLVAQGARLRSQRRVFDRAAELLKIQEKPLPLVGAACRLPDTPGGALPELDGRLYCTLPLPDPIGIPFHVNAFVDLDSSRRGPTASDDLAGNALLRKKWNEALLQDLVPEVAARLLVEIARRAARNELSEGASYQACPQTRGGRAQWAAEMVEALLERFASVPFVLHQSGDRLTLRAADDSRLAPSAWSADLRKAIVFDGFDIAHPPPPRDLIRSFNDVGVDFEEVDPDDFCDWLEEVRGDQWPSLKQAPLKCLRTELRLRKVIQFCSTIEGASLDGLPLGLRQDGTMVRFGAPDVVTFFGWPRFSELFPTCPQWFWGGVVEEEVRPSRVSSSAMTAETVVLNLKTYLRSAPTAWSRASSTPPNEGWLTKCLEFLAREPLSSGAVQVLRELALLPASDGQLHPPAGEDKVLHGVSKKLRPGLRKLGWYDIDASGPLLQAVEQLARRYPRVVPRCDGEEVCSLLVTSEHQRLAVLNDGEMWSLVDYVAKAWDDDEFFEIEELGGVPLWVTLEGTRVSADTPSTLLAVGFTPPPGLVSFRVVKQAQTQAIRRLQKALGLKELSPETFAVTLGATLSNRGTEGDAARAWVVEQNWRTWSTDTKRGLRESLRVPNESGSMRSPSDLFDPRQESILKLFRGRLHIPAKRYRSETWLGFLRHLGMRHHLTGSDLVSLVDAWAKKGAGTDSYDSLLAWLSAAFERADGDRKERAALEELVEPLKDKKWISTAIRATLSEAEARASRLRSPSGCVDHTWLDLVGETAPILPSQIRASLRDALGALQRPMREHVLQQFEIATQREGDAKQLERYALLLLRWIGTEAHVPQRLQTAAWIPSGARRYPPKKVFFEDVRFSAGFFAQPESSLTKSYKAALEAVGVRQRPDVDALVSLVQELSAADDEDSVLLDVAGHAYQRLERLHVERSDSWPAREDTRRWLAPTRAGRFLELCEVVLDDAPWLAETLKGAAVPWLHESVSPGFADVLGARRASDAIRQQMVNGVTLSAACPELPRLRGLVEDGAFRSALQRLLRHLLSGRSREELLGIREEARRIRVEIRAYGSLTVRWSLDAVELADSDEEVFVDRAGDRIAISVAGEEKRWYVMVARGLAEGLGYEELFNDAALEELLGASPGDDLHQLLDGRRIPADPDAVDAVVAALPELNSGLDDVVDPAERAPEDEAQFDDDSDDEEPDSEIRTVGPEREPSTSGPGDVHVREHTRSLPVRGASGGGPGGGGSGDHRREKRSHDLSREQDAVGVESVDESGAEDIASVDRSEGAGSRVPRGGGSGQHWVDGHYRRNPSSTGESPRGWEQHPPLGPQVEEDHNDSGSSAAKEEQTASAPKRKSASMRGAVRVVPDDAFKRSKRFTQVVRALGERSGAKRIEYMKGKKNPEMWLTLSKDVRVAVFVCVLDGSWDDQLPDLRASAMEMLHKWGRKAELWVVERVKGEDHPYKLREPLQEAYTFKFGRHTRGQVQGPR